MLEMNRSCLMFCQKQMTRKLCLPKLTVFLIISFWTQYFILHVNNNIHILKNLKCIFEKVILKII